jgi:hypothetical protein
MSDARLIRAITSIELGGEDVVVDGFFADGEAFCGLRFTKENSGAGDYGTGGVYSKLKAALVASQHGAATIITDEIYRESRENGASA